MMNLYDAATVEKARSHGFWRGMIFGAVFGAGVVLLVLDLIFRFYLRAQFGN